jgi:hypothetical protein
VYKNANLEMTIIAWHRENVDGKEYFLHNAEKESEISTM